MAPTKHTMKRQTASGRFVLGRDRLEKISAVEGIKTTSETRRMFRNFERDGLSADERRKAILRKYKQS